MFRLLLSPRWIVGHVLLIAGVILFVTLGFWQLRRLNEVRTTNALITERLEAAPRPLDEVLGVYDDVDALAYRRVTASGRYLPDGELLTIPRSRAGQPGHHLLTPLDTAAGGVLLVDRGWIPFERDPDLSAVAPPPGEVRVEGILMPPEPGDAGSSRYLARIDPSAATERNGLAMLPAFLLLQDQQPGRPGDLPLRGAEPVLDEGNHLSYAVQWFLFALTALVGYPFLVRRALRDRGTADAAEEPVPRRADSSALRAATGRDR